MKTASIVFLCISLIVAGIGFVLCSRAEKMAEAENIELFTSSQDGNGNRVSVVDYDPDECEKILITLKSGNVTVKNGEKCRIEIFNLYEGMYFKGTSNNMVQVNDTLGIVDIVKEGALGISFSGLRNILHDFSLIKASKSITVYVPEGTDLNAIEIHALDGNILVEDIYDTSADIILRSDAGNVTMRNCSTNSCLEIYAKEGNVSLAESFGNDIRIYSETGNVGVSGTAFKSFYTEITSEGDMSISLMQGLSRYKCDLSSDREIIFNGAGVGTDSFATESASGMSITIKCSKGTVSVRDN